ncbi:MAG: YbaB/EbfC family nucleoid-associated protein [Phycisphaeraceae bacterium]|nr:YbaB/EbfC family nucleoid-associated protein [Phycisphaeraceae bacterium]
MFEGLKAAGALAGLMKNKDALKAAGQRIQVRLTEIRASGTAGSGAVRVSMDGKLRVLEVRLDPAMARSAFADPASAAYAESLITEAINDAIRQAQAMAHRELAREAEALGIPNLPTLDSLTGA